MFFLKKPSQVYIQVVLFYFFPLNVKALLKKIKYLLLGLIISFAAALIHEMIQYCYYK